jgi:hypothetical protein
MIIIDIHVNLKHNFYYPTTIDTEKMEIVVISTFSDTKGELYINK